MLAAGMTFKIEDKTFSQTKTSQLRLRYTDNNEGVRNGEKNVQGKEKIQSFPHFFLNYLVM